MSEIPTIRDLRYVSLALYLSKLSEYFHRILSCGPLVSILLVIYVVATTTYSATTLFPDGPHRILNTSSFLGKGVEHFQNCRLCHFLWTVGTNCGGNRKTK